MQHKVSRLCPPKVYQNSFLQDYRGMMIHINQNPQNRPLMVELIVVLKTTSTKTTKTTPMVCESLPTSNNPDLYNNFVTVKSDYTGCFCINYPIQCVLGYVFFRLQSIQPSEFMEENCPTIQESKGYRPTQTETKQKQKSKEDKAEE